MDRRHFLTRAALAAASLPLIPRGWARSAPSLSIETSIWVYLWDIVDEGYGSLLGRLRENGLRSLSLATAYHAGKFLSPHNPRRKVIILEDGAVSFSPRPALYGRIRPIVHSLVGQGHDLRRVQYAAQQQGLATRSWVVCCHNTPLGLQYPDITSRTAFGDALPHNLCPCNDDVRAYLRALVRDIASYGVDTIELEALQFQGYTHGFHHEREGIPLTLPVRFLLGLCFCPSCAGRAAAASVPFEPLRTYVRDTLAAYFADPLGSPAARLGTLEDLPAELFTPFFSWRESVISSLAGELREAAGPDGPALRPLVGPDPVARKIVGMNPVEVGKVTGGILLLAYVKQGEEIRPEIDHLRSALGDNEVRVGMHLGMPETGGKAEFLSRMAACCEAGVRQFSYYNYSFVPLSNLGWIREALSRCAEIPPKP
jgi:hypothetical protein